MKVVFCTRVYNMEDYEKYCAKAGHNLSLSDSNFTHRFIEGIEANIRSPIALGLYTEDGIPLYRWEGGQVVRRSEEEVQADRAALPAPAPSEQERLRADVDFLAAMQGVTL